MNFLRTLNCRKGPKKFPPISHAQVAEDFEEMASRDLEDIYLYKDGNLVNKYD